MANVTMVQLLVPETAATCGVHSGPLEPWTAGEVCKRAGRPILFECSACAQLSSDGVKYR